MNDNNNTSRRDLEAPKPTIVERAITAVSPRWGFRRHNFRVALGQQRKYEAAEAARTRKVRQSKLAADAVSGSQIETLRFRGRDLDENYDIASGILDVLESKTVGSEILAHPMVVLEGAAELAVDLNKHLARLYREWAVHPDVTRQCSLGKTQRLIARSWFRDGEAFVHHLDGKVPGLEHATAVPYSIQMLEADMVPLNLTGAGTHPHGIRYGIVTDDWGRPIQYVVHKVHPGADIWRLGMRTVVRVGDVELVDAFDISHVKHVKRIGQARGISVFSTVFNRLTDLKDYEESEQTAARIGSYIALAITKSVDSVGTAGSGGKAPREMDWMPGMIFDQLVEGEKVESIKNERPSNQIAPFRTSSLRAVSAGTRAGHSSISHEYTGTYSAQRQELVESEAHYDVLTEELVSMIVRPEYRRFVNMAIVSGQVPIELLRGVDLDTVFNAAYRGPAVAYIDPKKEVDSEVIGVQAGFISKQLVQLKRGNNPFDVDAQIAQEREREAELGIITTSNPANKVGGSITVSMPAATDADDDDEMIDDDSNRYIAIGGRWVPVELQAAAESIFE